MIYQLVSFSDDISVYRCNVERSQDICRTQMYCMHSAISPKAKKGSSHFAFSYVFKINFYKVKIYFTHVLIIFTSMCHGLAQALVFFAEISADNHDQIRFP